MDIKRFFLIITVLTISQALFGQPKSYFTHYGTEDGLPQNTVMDIIQDKKDFIWLSTWNGLSKFDGYNFHNFKIQQGDKYHMRSSRIDFICEDKYGYIWTLPYDREPHRFDPKTEKFMGIRLLEGYQDYTFLAKKIIPTKSGKVWLISDDMGCVNIIDSTFKIDVLNVENKKIFGNKVYNVFEDNEEESWILTDNGLYQQTKNGEKINSFFFEMEHKNSKKYQNFYSALEINNQIWFGSDNGRIWIFTKNNKLFNLLELKTNSYINDLKKIDDDNILIATRNDGFFIYKNKTQEIKKFDSSKVKEIPIDNIISTYVDKSKNIWLEVAAIGVIKFNPTTQSIKRFVSEPENLNSTVFPPNFFIFEDINNRLWVHPRGGGFSLYDPINDKLIPFYNDPSSPAWRFSNLLHAGFSDKQGNLWLSTRSHGLEKIVFNNDIFKPLIVDPNMHSTVSNDIRCVFEDHLGRLWVSSKGGKLYVYNSDNKQIGYLSKDGQIGKAEPLKGVVYTVTEDRSNNIWVGTKGEGLYKLIPTSDSNVFKIEQYKNSDQDLYSLSNNSIYSIFEDSKNHIWIGTYGGGLNMLDPNKDGRFFNSKNILKNYPIQYGSQIRIISSDNNSNICIGTTLGLIMFSSDFESLNTIDYRSYIRNPSDENSISANDIYDICTTTKGETYFATFGGGVNKIEEVDKQGFPSRFTSFTTKDGLASDVILNIIEDTSGDLWIATEGKLTKFNLEKNTFETYSEINRLIEGQSFSEGARCASKSGILYFGYSKGFISISPNKIQANTFKPYVALTNFQISNKNVPIEEHSFMKENIDDLKSIELNHDQNFISIEFAALDFVQPSAIVYAYKLDGFDEDWITTAEQRIANYTNLSPGEYLFRVKSTNSDGIWLENEHTLVIEITPSFWQTKWAYTLYTVVVVILLYLIFHSLFVFYRLRAKVALEKDESEMKARFFTDISHEIRTPLTMIVSPIENMLENNDTSKDAKAQLHLVLKNANRMLRMVNQILDFRKIQKQRLNIHPVIIGVYITEICANFSKTAEFKSINIKINNTVDREKIWVDKDSFEKLIYNLLINALKYSPEGKSIEVNISKYNNQICLQVKDQGNGMTKEVLNKLFTRFASFNKDKNNPSTGIGLSIVKEIVDKHKARISVESEVGMGSIFTIFFLTGFKHFEDDPNVYIYSDGIDDSDISSTKAPVVNMTEKHSLDGTVVLKKEIEKKDTILLVEDDSELRGFLSSILASSYNILEAENGKIGFEIAKNQIPDFIISDIMMPIMDGIELLGEIKSDTETSHIPFILLTAKSNIESKLGGLDYGADDYIVKPFSVKYLKARIENIIRQRKLLYEIYTKGNQLQDEVQEESRIEQNKPVITTQDEAFIKKIQEEIEKNIDNSDYLIDDLSTAMAMSRTVFFKKLKSLTGLAPIEFIRDVKIKYAAKLLETNDYSVKEISYMVGISDAKYFTQCFKKIYGMTPTDYKKKKK